MASSLPPYIPAVVRDNLFKGLSVIASRGTGFNIVGALSNGTDTSGTTRSTHIIAVSSTEIRLLFGNFYNDTAVSSQPGLNSITVGAAVDPPWATPQSSSSAGFAYPVFFNGMSPVLIGPGGFAMSDPLPISVVAGQALSIRTYVSVATSGMKWPATLTAYSNAFEGYIANTNALASNTAITTGNGAKVYSPCAILGTPVSGVATPRSWAAIGDSITYGTGDNFHNDLGYFVRACNAASIGYMNVAKPGEKAYDFVGLSTGSSGDSYYRLPLAVSCSRAIEAMGTNDFAGGLTLAQIQLAKIQIWTWLAQRGINTYATTILPKVTSTDGLTTTANQTVTANESVRIALNTWTRDGAPMLNGVAVATGSNAPVLCALVNQGILRRDILNWLIRLKHRVIQEFSR